MVNLEGIGMAATWDGVSQITLLLICERSFADQIPCPIIMPLLQRIRPDATGFSLRLHVLRTRIEDLYLSALKCPGISVDYQYNFDFPVPPETIECGLRYKSGVLKLSRLVET